MPDAIDLAMVTQSALPAAFAFVFDQVSSLLTRRRERWSKPADLTVDRVPAELAGTLSFPLKIDKARLDARACELEAYICALARYRDDPSLITASDAALMTMLSRARDALEEIHGQRFTFIGEQRPSSGPFVGGRVKEVSGDLVGMEATTSIHGNATVNFDVEVIQPGGKVVGMSAPVIDDAI